MVANKIQELSMADITSEDNIRTEMEEASIDGLAQSMKSVGQLVPIRVREVHEKSFRVTDGSRRLRAAKRLGWETIEAIVDSCQLEHGTDLTMQLVANCQRADLPVLDKSRAIERLMKSMGWNASDVAGKLGMSNAAVTRLVSLLSLPESIKGWVDSGKIPPSTASELARITDPSKQYELAQQAAEGKLTRDAAVGIVRQKSSQSKPSGRGPCRAVAKLDAVRSVSLSGTNLSLDSMIGSLEELLSKARKARTQGFELATFLKMLTDQAKGGV